MEIIDYHFRVALSFPGEYRSFVEKVAEQLAKELGREKVFYDKYYEAQLAILNLDIHLQDIYGKQCDLIVIFICKSYEKKEWCRLEWRAIRNIIKTKLNESPSAIMPIRMEDCSVPGLFSTDGYIDVGNRLPPQIASLIIERLDDKKGTSVDDPIPLTEVKADSSEWSYSMLDPGNFDLEGLINDCLNIVLKYEQGLVGLAVPYNEDPFLDYFSERLKKNLGKNYITKHPLTLDHRITSIDTVVNIINGYKPSLEKNHVICPIRLAGAKPTSSQELWQKMSIEFQNTSRRLIIVMVSSKSTLFPENVKILYSPKFREADVYKWICNVTKNQEWTEEDQTTWRNYVVKKCKQNGGEFLNIRLVYDHLDETINLFRQGYTKPEDFIKKLEPIIYTDV